LALGKIVNQSTTAFPTFEFNQPPFLGALLSRSLFDIHVRNEG